MVCFLSGENALPVQFWCSTIVIQIGTHFKGGIMHGTPKIKTAYRLTPEAVRLLDEIAKIKGLNRTATVELIIREAAKREGIK
jgi:hypothetical protein